MKYTWQRQLAMELRQAGASTTEARQLLPLAANLEVLHTEPPVAKRAASAWLRFLRPALFVTSGLALGMFIIIAAQGLLPTSPFYPVQKLSDHVAVSIHPRYRMSVMMRQAQQVNELVGSHASSKIVLATLNEYDATAATYKSAPGANYAALEYCKSNLRHAAQTAPAAVRQAITTSLDSLSSV